MPPHDPFGFAGALIDAQIQVGEPVGEGGFSVVYKARHLGLDEQIALKCLKRPAGLDAKMSGGIVERFRAESRISYRLSQGNLDIVRSVSSGAAHSPSTGELIPYIALEWLEGPSLQQDLKRRRAEKLKGRPLPEVLDILDPAAIALDYAHKQGVVHRDVKPGNLVLAKTRDGGTRIKVLDFGLAKVIDPDGIGLVATAQTVMSVILCSPGYGAPEQFDSSLGPIGNYTDVYSFALIVLEMMRDEKVRPSGSVAVSAKEALATKPVSPLALKMAVSPAFDDLFQRTLNRDKAKRPKDMGEFWGELKHLAKAGAGALVVDIAPSPLSVTGANIGRKPAAHNVTLPMKKPPLPAAGKPPEPPEDMVATLFNPGPKPEKEGAKGTVIMAARPTPAPAAAPVPPVVPAAGSPPPMGSAAQAASAQPPLGPTTAPMAGMPVVAHGAVHPPGTLNPDDASTRIGEPLPAGLVPGAGASPPMGAPGGAPTPAKPPAPAKKSRVLPAILLVLSVLVFSSLVVTAGYFAHSWFAAREGR